MTTAIFMSTSQMATVRSLVPLYGSKFWLKRPHQATNKIFKRPFSSTGKVHLDLWAVKHARSRSRIGEDHRNGRGFPSGIPDCRDLEAASVLFDVVLR